MKDKLKNRDIEVEVNWTDNEDVKGCKALRFHVGDETFIITQVDLLTLMLIIGSRKTQKKLTPMNLRRVKKMERLLDFVWTASRNYKAGEKITVRAPWIDMLDETEAVYAGAVANHKKQTNQSKIYLT